MESSEPKKANNSVVISHQDTVRDFRDSSITQDVNQAYKSSKRFVLDKFGTSAPNQKPSPDKLSDSQNHTLDMSQQVEDNYSEFLRRLEQDNKDLKENVQKMEYESRNLKHIKEIAKESLMKFKKEA